jgi:hypothetical protein
LKLEEELLDFVVCAKKSHDAVISETKNSAAVALMTGLECAFSAGLGTGIDLCFERLPALEPLLFCNELLRIAQCEPPREDFRVAQPPIARQHGPDLRHHRER